MAGKAAIAFRHDRGAPLVVARTDFRERRHAGDRGRSHPAAAHARCRGGACARRGGGRVIPKNAVGPIATAARADLYDIAALGEAAATAGNVAIPLVKALTAEVAKADKAAAGFVHWGATSQDIVDTALMLELSAAIDALTADLDRAIVAFSG